MDERSFESHKFAKSNCRKNEMKTAFCQRREKRDFCKNKCFTVWFVTIKACFAIKAVNIAQRRRAIFARVFACENDANFDVKRRFNCVCNRMQKL